jgi:hypothetical protein
MEIVYWTNEAEFMWNDPHNHATPLLIDAVLKKILL